MSSQARAYGLTEVMQSADGFEIALLEKCNSASSDYELSVSLTNTNDRVQFFSSSSFFLGLHYANCFSAIDLIPHSPLPLSINAKENTKTVLLRGLDLPTAKDGELILPTPPAGEVDLKAYESLAGLAKTCRFELGVIYSYPVTYEVLLPRGMRFWRKRKVETCAKFERLSASMILSLP